MIGTAYNQGFVDAARRFSVDIEKLAMAAGTATAPRASSAAEQPQSAPSVPPGVATPATLPTAPFAPNARPTL